MTRVTRFAFSGLIALAAAAVAVSAQSSESDKHVAAAKAAAGTDFAGVFNRICTEAVPSATASTGRGRAAGARPPGPPPRESWHADPVQVFDNLYFLGQTEYSVWGIKTSAGMILLDAI